MKPPLRWKSLCSYIAKLFSLLMSHTRSIFHLFVESKLCGNHQHLPRRRKSRWGLIGLPAKCLKCPWFPAKYSSVWCLLNALWVCKLLSVLLLWDLRRLSDRVILHNIHHSTFSVVACVVLVCPPWPSCNLCLVQLSVCIQP